MEMMTLARRIGGLLGLLLLSSGAGLAQQQLSVEMHKVSEAGIGDKIGAITITEGKSGATFTVAVAGIPAGAHGFHVHEKGDCATALKDGKPEPAGAAGPHYDPDAKNTHKGPSGGGHAGDLPLLTGNATGINHAVEAPGLKVADIRGRALVIHESGDYYTDIPENGGGKGRIACGVVPKS
jgi:Cu-Zn family superoxide dismutase